MFDLLFHGFSNALSWTNLFYLFIGVLWGNWLGVLPGIGPIQGTALLVPLTMTLSPTTAILTLAGVYYGAFYGGSTTSILLNIPGEPASVMTAVEGYPLTLQGRGGAALGMSAISSFFAGTLAVIGVMLLSAPMAEAALSFGPPENFALIICAFTLIGTLSSDSLLKGMAVAAFGVVMTTIGIEPISASTRLTFGIGELNDGISFIAAAMGLFSLPEVFESMEQPAVQVFKKIPLKIKNLMPSWQDYKDSRRALPMGAFVGFLCGIMPGGGATIASFLAYVVQKRIAVKPELFGKGSIEAIAAVEGANNAAAESALIPMLTFGIPGSATAAIIMAAMIIHGIRPGPLLFQSNPDIVWTLIASMYLGNVMLLILNLPLIGMWISFLRLPQRPILTAILALTVAGVYAEENSMGGVYIMFIFGILGYFFKKFDFPPAPLLMGLILTEQMEAALRQSLMISAGSLSIFISRPISLTFISIAIISVVMQTPIFSKSIGLIRSMMLKGEVK